MDRFKQTVKYLWSDEQGAEGLEKLLLIAAIVLPLVGLLLFFRTDITEWVTGKYDEVKSDAN